ncbi:MAG: ATP-binding protein [Bacillota bacterium]
MQREGLLIAEALGKIPLKDVNIRDVVSARRELKVLDRFIESKVIVINSERKVLYTNLEQGDRKVIGNLIQQNEKSDSKGFVIARIPVKNTNGSVKAHVILLTYDKDIKNIGGIFRRTQLLSIMIAGLTALVVGGLFGRSMTKPLAQLKAGMAKFSMMHPVKIQGINTGDEIEELAGSFNKMVEKLKSYDEQQKRFLQNTSHELKTPLMSIQGYAEAIKDGVVVGTDLEESLEIIIEESQRLKRVVEDLVFLTKLENAEDIYHYTHQEVGDLAQRAAKSLKSLADEKGVSINIYGDLKTMGNFDGDKLKRALINIIGNGLRYAEKQININIKNKDTFFEIIISDDGPGFKNGEEKKIFERFYKGELGLTGLGLAITKAIIEGHKGCLEAYNGTPNGAVFRITIPISY